MLEEKRVVITGLGAITPLGNSVQEFWNNALAGKSGAAKITHFDTSLFKTKFACEVKNFKPEDFNIDRKEIRKNDSFTLFALAATSEALTDSKLDLEKISPYDVGVIWGSGQGGMETYEVEVKNYTNTNYTPKFNPFFVPKMIVNMAAGMISIKYGLKGINYTTVSACATSNTSIMDAFNYIRFGKAKVFVTGGSEAAITEAGIGGFNAMKALSTNNEEIESASRPLDKSRDGFVMGEGAGALILEEYEHAKKRGAKIYAEVAGAAMTADAYHIFAPHPEGEGAAVSMQKALKDANISPADVDYLNAHSTSTPVGDGSEIKAVKKVFGDNAKLKISATKSMTGHLLGAAGAIESILCIKAITDGVIPPTINSKNFDDEVTPNINIVTDKKLEQSVNVAMTNSFGFGGHNATLVFKKLN